MLESKQPAAFWYFLDVDVPNSINDLAKKALKELAYLFLPEDTTGQADGRQNESIGLGNTRGMIKVVFWVFMAIIISLAVGQLK